MKEWPTVFDQLHMKNIYNSDLGYDLEYDITKVYKKCYFKYHDITVNEFLDQYPLPTNAREVENQRHMVRLNFPFSLNPDYLKLEAIKSLGCSNSFWNLPDINTQLSNFLLNNWCYDKKFNNRYCFDFVDCLLEIMWVRGRMPTAKNMNVNNKSNF